MFMAVSASCSSSADFHVVWSRHLASNPKGIEVF